MFSPTQARQTDTIIGHLINPQVCGISPSEVDKMSFSHAAYVIESVGLSNEIINKSEDS